MAQAGAVFSYVVDAKNQLVELPPGWDAFAVENDAPELVRPKVLGVSLYSFIADPTTAQLTGDLLARARRGVPVEYPFRCDAPALRRFMRMRMTGRESGHLELSTFTEAVEARAPVPLLLRSMPRTDELITICAWCKKVPLAERWVEIEVAVEALKLFDVTRLPALTHGICPRCAEDVLRP